MARDRLTETSIVKLSSKDAAAVFVARNGGEGLNSDEELVLAEWLKKSEDNRREYENADRIWQTFVNIKGDEVMAAMRAHAETERPKRVVTWKIALATAVLVVLAIVATLLLTRTDAPTIAVVPYSTLRTQLQEQTLPDGSKLSLDADSSVEGRFGPVGRQVKMLKGRASFNVAADKARTFVVIAGGRSIIAVGTRFDVNLANGALIVTLLEGHVIIETTQKGGAPLVLERGQQFIERDGHSAIRALGADAEDAVAWQTGVSIFADQPLGEVVQIMNRYTLDEIVIKDPAVAALPISGRFRNGDTAGFVATVAASQSLKSVRTDKQITLTRD